MSRTGEALGAIYDGLPGYKVGGTSKEAATNILPTLNERQQEVIDALRADELAGGTGLTADQCAIKIGRDEKAVRPRFTELGRHKRLIEKTGEKRKNESGLEAAVWRLKK